MGPLSNYSNLSTRSTDFGASFHFLGIRLSPLLLRFIFLLILFTSELISISVWLDTEALVGNHGLTGVIGDLGSWILRGVVVFATTYLLFGYARTRTVLCDTLPHPGQLRISPLLLAAHFAAIGLFVGLSAVLFGHSIGLRTNTVAVIWLAMGLAAIALGVLSAFPLKFCVRFLRAGGTAWIYALVTSGAAVLVNSLTRSLGAAWTNLTFHFVRSILAPFFQTFNADPATRILGTEKFSVEVAWDCSGIEGAGLMLVFGLAWLWYFRRNFQFPAAFVLLPVGVCISWFVNAFRIAALILIGNAGAPNVALGGFHSQAGWIGFTGVALGLFGFAPRLPWVGVNNKHRNSDTADENRAVAYLMPLLAIMAASMVSRAAAGSEAEWLYPLRFLAASGVLYFFRASYRRLNWSVGLLSPIAGIAVFLIWVGLEPATTGNAGVALRSTVESWPSISRTTWLGFRTIASVITVPIAEELAFRGFLIRRIMSVDFDSLGPRAFTFLSVLLSSVAFGLLHGDRWLAGTAAGLVYAVVFLRRGRIGDAVMAHATTNGLIAFLVLARGHWSLW
jgi:exosortase E/protease (VPEID-CTERM system)